jgi:hypothetical protein
VRIIDLIKIFLVLFLFYAGCEQKSKPDVISIQTNNELEKLSIYSRYSPTEIEIIPLTDFVRMGDTQQARIDLYVRLLDSFGSEIKSPCIFRFELYKKVPRSAEPKGARVMIWPDVDLTEPAINNRYWRNFLRAYEFNLPFGEAIRQTYILEVTCLCPTGRRLISDYTLNAQKESAS